MQNPRTIKEVRDLVEQGDTSITARLLAGEFNSLPQDIEEYIDETSVESDEGTLEEEAIAEVPSEDKQPDFDAVEHERRLYDEEMERARVERAEILERESKAMQIAEASRKETEKLYKELEETRRAFDVEFDSDAEQSPVGLDQSNGDQEVVADGFNVAEELKALKRQINEEKVWNETVEQYSEFWNTDIGKQMSPSTKPREALKSFDAFYGDLANGFKNERDALRLMHDIRKNGMNEHYKERLDFLGVRVPEDFDKMYDSFEIRTFADGNVIDPKRGQLVPSGRGVFTSLEDAYLILNKNKVRMSDRESGYNDLRNKLKEKENAAVTVEPSSYRSIPSSKTLRGDKSTMETMIRQAVSHGYNGDINSIKDQSFKQEFIKMYGSYMGQ